MTLLHAGKMERSCEGLQNQLWKSSVTLPEGKSCKTEPSFANSHPLNLWLATDKIGGTCLMWRPPKLYALFKTYLQVFCMFPYQDNRLSNPELEAAGKLITGRSVSLSNTRMAHPCRVQVPLTFQCIFLPSALLNGECASPCLMSQESETQGDYMVRPRSHTLAEDEVKPKPSEPWAGSNSESHAVGRGSWGLPAGWKVLSRDLCPSSLLKPARWFLFALFLIALWCIRCPRTDHYAITFEVTFIYIPVQDSVLQTSLQKWLATLSFSIHKLYSRNIPK